MENDKNIRIKNIISENIFLKNKYLDLSNLNLKELPDDIFEAKHLECLYLSNNNLDEVPKNIFLILTKLQLLDLRFNKLSSLPREIEHLKNLEILLLDGNNLTILPNELGSLETLKGLNIGSNPITYPSPKVISSGYKAILNELNSHNLNHIQNGCGDVSAEKNIVANVNNEISLRKSRSSEKLYKPKIYKEIRQTFLDKNRKSSLGRTRTTMTQSVKQDSLVKMFPEPVSLESIERKMIEQMRLTKIKEIKIQKETVLQNVKDKNSISEWRDEARDLQVVKRREQFNKLPIDIKLESDSRIFNAPFKVDKEHLEMINFDELNSLKQISIPKTPKPQPMDRETKLLIEAEKRQRIKSLHSQIKSHSDYLVKKRNNPKGSVQDEVELSKKDLEVLMKLQKELHENFSVI